MKTALTIAGSDPTGGAGLQADLRTFHSMGVNGLSIPSVLTAQNTKGVFCIQEVLPDFFTAQFDTLLRDIRPEALKTGMLYSAGIIRITAEKIKEYSLDNLVIDPVILSSTGVPLVKEGAIEALKELLLPHAKIITPNIHEATALSGIQIETGEDMKRAASKLKSYGAAAVIITGGHMTLNAIDLLFDGEDFLSLEREKLTGEYHGTGCVFSSALTACLALGLSVRESFVKAKEFVWDAMRSAVAPGEGMKILRY